MAKSNEWISRASKRSCKTAADAKTENHLADHFSKAEYRHFDGEELPADSIDTEASLANNARLLDESHDSPIIDENVIHLALCMKQGHTLPAPVIYVNRSTPKTDREWIQILKEIQSGETLATILAGNNRFAALRKANFNYFTGFYLVVTDNIDAVANFAETENADHGYGDTPEQKRRKGGKAVKEGRMTIEQAARHHRITTREVERGIREHEVLMAYQQHGIEAPETIGTIEEVGKLLSKPAFIGSKSNTKKVLELGGNLRPTEFKTLVSNPLSKCRGVDAVARVLEDVSESKDYKRATDVEKEIKANNSKANGGVGGGKRRRKPVISRKTVIFQGMLIKIANNLDEVSKTEDSRQQSAGVVQKLILTTKDWPLNERETALEKFKAAITAIDGLK